MGVLDNLASSLGKRDEQSNIDLAIQLVRNSDSKSIAELVSNLSLRDKNIQNDCIKVLYEIGKRKPSLIREYQAVFLTCLTSENNRLQWGAMTAIASLVDEIPDDIYQKLPILSTCAENGSVITRDAFMSILIKLCQIRLYSIDAFSLFLEHLKSCPTNQLPMYAENAVRIKSVPLLIDFITVLKNRLAEVDKEPKKKRIEKVMAKCLKNNEM